MNKRVLLVDENDDEIEFEVSATFGLDEREYAVLFPVNSKEGNAYMLRIEYDEEDNVILVGIDNEEELEDVIFTYETFINEEYE